VETRCPLPQEIHDFVAIEWVKDKRVEVHRIRCSGGENPDQQIALIAHKLGREMEISDWRNNEADEVIEMDVREAKLIRIGIHGSGFRLANDG
jgi:hypothetical protein